MSQVVMSYQNPLAAAAGAENEVGYQSIDLLNSPPPPAYPINTTTINPSAQRHTPIPHPISRPTSSMNQPITVANNNPQQPHIVHYQLDTSTGRIYPVFQVPTSGQQQQQQEQPQMTQSTQQPITISNNNNNNNNNNNKQQQVHVQLSPLSARLHNEYPLYFVIFHGVLLILLGVIQITVDLLLISKDDDFLNSFGGKIIHNLFFFSFLIRLVNLK